MAADEAIVLVGGLGTRLRTIVSHVPKPLAPVAGRPFLAWMLDRLAATGMRRVILATGYMADIIEQMVGSSWAGMDIVYSREDRPLGTGGAIRAACSHLHGTAVHVLNGDTYLAYDPFELERETLAAGGAIGIALAAVPDVTRYGAVRCEAGRIVGLDEKGGCGPGLINAGAYFLTPALVADLPAMNEFSMEREVLAPLAQRGRAFGFQNTRDFIDIGVPDDYRRAQDLFAQR